MYKTRFDNRGMILNGLKTFWKKKNFNFTPGPRPPSSSWQTAFKVAILFLEYFPKWFAAQKFLLRGLIEGFNRIEL